VSEGKRWAGTASLDFAGLRHAPGAHVRCNSSHRIKPRGSDILLLHARAYLALAVLCTSVSTTTLAIAANDGVQHRFITLGTGSPSGVYHAAGQAICEAVNRAAERHADRGDKIVTICRAGPSGGSVFNIRQVASGAFTFAIVQANDQRAAVEGSDPQRVKNVPDLRSVFSLQPEVLQVVIPAGSDMNSVADLSARHISSGNRGSGTRVLTNQLVEAFGLSLDNGALAENLSMEMEAETLCSGQVDAFVTVSAVPTPSVVEATKRCGAQLMPLQGPEITSWLAESADLSEIVIPANVYPGIHTPTPTIGVRAGLVTREAVPAYVVHDVVAAVFEELPLLRAAHPSLESLQPREMATEGLGAPLHAGAMEYFMEHGWR
jgi:uncharacterized protein